jgi:hypothetical protein
MRACMGNMGAISMLRRTPTESSPTAHLAWHAGAKKSKREKLKGGMQVLGD